MTAARPAAVACAGALAAIALTACESSQSKSARLRAEAKSSPAELGLTIGKPSADVRVTSSTVLTDEKAKRSAAVISLRNDSRTAQTALPLIFTLTDAGGRKVFTNASPGASADLISVPSLQPGDTLDWVNDAIVDVAGAAKVEATVGAGTVAAGEPPRLRISTPRIESDPIDGYTAVGRAFNSSTIAQERLVIFAVARRGAKIVAAGRAVVPALAPGPKGAPFTVFFVGDPRGGRLSLSAPPVTFVEKGAG